MSSFVKWNCFVARSVFFGDVTDKAGASAAEDWAVNTVCSFIGRGGAEGWTLSASLGNNNTTGIG